jgi:hypothetical protein
LDKERVIILKSGSPKMASDLSGLIYFDFIEEKKSTLKRKLQKWVLGIGINESARDKLVGNINTDSYADIQDTHELRKKMIANSQSEIVCVGPSLNTAFNRLFHSSSGNISASLIDVLVSKKVAIRIFITNPDYISDGANSPLHMGVVRIKETVNTLSEMVTHLVGESKKTSIAGSLHIYYVNYPDLDHIIMVDDALIFRPTMLWDYHSRCKGNVSRLDKSMKGYEGCRSYISLLIENAKKIDDPHFQSSEDVPVYCYVVDVEIARRRLWELEKKYDLSDAHGKG